MTLARARLLLGVAAVGSTVLLAGGVLGFDLADQHLSNDPSAPLTVALAEALLGPLLWMLAMLPLDAAGGLVAVRQRPTVTEWLAAWLRGVAVQLLVLAAGGAALLLATRHVGAVGTVVVAGIGAALTLARLDFLARLGTPLPTHSIGHGDFLPPDAGTHPPLTIVSARDEAFVGGYAGLWRPRLLVPASWGALPSPVAKALLVRRRVAAGRPRLGGLAAAVGWIMLGAAVVAFGIDAPSSAASLVNFAAGMTLWSFVGVLLLPTPSRRAVLALDATAAKMVGAAALSEGITAIDQRQDDEPERAGWIEAIFHPVPSRSTRLRAIAAEGDHAPKGASAWRVARLALPAGLASWSFLGRAVHCNLGRPTLWWMLPGD